jgi:MFS family permease
VIVDRVARRAGTRGKVLLAAAAVLCAVPSAVAVASGSGAVAAVLVAEVTFASSLFGTTMLSVIPEVAPLGARGFAVSLYAFSMTMIGGSLGPIAVASLTEHVFGDPRAVGASMAIVGTSALVASALLAVQTARSLPRA